MVTQDFWKITHNNKGGTEMRNAIKDYATPTLALLAFFMLFGIVGRMEFNATNNAIPSGCVVTHVEPSGPEPDVSIWHRHISCGQTEFIQEFTDDAPCGFVIEEGAMIAASCSNAADLALRMETIRERKSGFRAWEVTR